MAETLRQKQSRFVRHVGRLIAFATENGYELTFGECYRTPQQAQYNAEHGLGISNSLHTSRLAIDLNLFKDGALLNTVDGYLPLGQFWEALSEDATWGGRFETRKDPYHFSLKTNGIR